MTQQLTSFLPLMALTLFLLRLRHERVRLFGEQDRDRATNLHQGSAGVA
ncbi:hypothetical protein [Marinobacter sp. F4216]|nr:hypothetical protein [Marinobacter sp. F4216]MBZ2170291.1 hypothetical protein [Marinobacter sp. F4216]